MQNIWIQKAFAPIKRVLPRAVWQPFRALITGLLVPILFSYRSGHFKSALRAASVARDGSPLPWYTYPIIDFLAMRDFSRKTVLEFGGGNSTLWWARRAAFVFTIEDDQEWGAHLKSIAPANVVVVQVSWRASQNHVAEVARKLDGKRQFDVVVIDGCRRDAMVPMAITAMAPGGALICDNAEGYGFAELLKGRGLQRVDFHGYVPGVVNPHFTSIWFRPECFLFADDVPIRK